MHFIWATGCPRGTATGPTSVSVTFAALHTRCFLQVKPNKMMFSGKIRNVQHDSASSLIKLTQANFSV